MNGSKEKEAKLRLFFEEIWVWKEMGDWFNMGEAKLWERFYIEESLSMFVGWKEKVSGDGENKGVKGRI